MGLSFIVLAVKSSVNNNNEGGLFFFVNHVESILNNFERDGNELQVKNIQ